MFPLFLHCLANHPRTSDSRMPIIISLFPAVPICTSLSSHLLSPFCSHPSSRPCNASAHELPNDHLLYNLNPLSVSVPRRTPRRCAVITAADALMGPSQRPAGGASAPWEKLGGITHAAQGPPRRARARNGRHGRPSPDPRRTAWAARAAARARARVAWTGRLEVRAGPRGCWPARRAAMRLLNARRHAPSLTSRRFRFGA